MAYLHHYSVLSSGQISDLGRSDAFEQQSRPEFFIYIESRSLISRVRIYYNGRPGWEPPLHH